MWYQSRRLYRDIVLWFGYRFCQQHPRDGNHMLWGNRGRKRGTVSGHTHTHTHMWGDTNIYYIYRECRWVHSSSVSTTIEWWETGGGVHRETELTHVQRGPDRVESWVKEQHILQVYRHFLTFWHSVCCSHHLNAALTQITDMSVYICTSASEWGCLKLAREFLFELETAREVKRKVCACLPNDKIMEDNPNCLFLIILRLWTWA